MGTHENCTIRQRRLLDYAGEGRRRLPSDLWTHLRQCRDCRVFWEDLDAMKELFDTVAPGGPPEGFAMRVVAVVRRKADCRTLDRALTVLACMAAMEALVVVPGVRRAGLYLGNVITVIRVHASFVLSALHSISTGVWSGWRNAWIGLQHAAAGPIRIDWSIAVLAVICAASAYRVASRFPRTG